MPTESFTYPGGRKRVYIGGTFDLFHPGHVELLRRAFEVYGEVWVALNTDEFCAQYKRKPIMSYAERRAMLESCKYVHRVIENVGGFDSKPSILECDPHVIIHGTDWVGESFKKQLGVTDEFLKENEIDIAYFQYTEGVSTTDIIKRCLASQS